MKQIFQRLSAVVAAAQLCVDLKNLKCIQNLTDYYLKPGMQQGINSSYGQTQQFFQKLLKVVQKAINSMSALSKNAFETGNNILDHALNAIATQTNQYRHQYSKI